MDFKQALIKSINNLEELNGIDIYVAANADVIKDGILDVEEEGNNGNIEIAVKSKNVDEHLLISRFVSLLSSGEIEVTFNKMPQEDLDYIKKLCKSIGGD